MYSSLEHADMIGVFDSGIGGLTVVRAILNRFPAVDLVYFGDTARFPYGTRSSEEICRFAEQDVRLLVKKGADMIVIGCHTAAVVATESLRSTFPSLPIVSVLEQGIADALRVSRSGHIAVLGTDRTAHVRAHEHLLHRLDPTCRVTTIGLSPLVPLIEAEHPDDAAIKEVMGHFLEPLRPSDVDVAILACTHFPLIRSAFAQFFGEGVTLIDPAEDLARTLHALPQAPADRAPVRSFFFSSLPQTDRMRQRLLGETFTPILCTT